MFAFPLLAFLQETAEKAEKGNFYFLFSGLVIFLALIGVYSLFEKIRDRLNEKKDHAEEASRRLKTQKKTATTP